MSRIRRACYAPQWDSVRESPFMPTSPQTLNSSKESREPMYYKRAESHPERSRVLWEHLSVIINWGTLVMTTVATNQSKSWSRPRRHECISYGNLWCLGGFIRRSIRSSRSSFGACLFITSALHSYMRLSFTICIAFFVTVKEVALFCVESFRMSH